jgi:hypothetical protein
MIEVSPELSAFLKEEYDRCIDTELEEERENAIDRYNGEPYGDEQAGSSQAETVDYMVISILRTIISGERVVEFTHRDAEKAHEATETIMHLLMDEQDGYSILHDWLKSGLLEKNAVAMTYPEKRPPKRVEGVVPAPMIPEDALEAEEVGIDAEGIPQFRVVVKRDQGPKFCDAAVPNEEFYCSPDARTLTEAPLKGRRVRKTLSDLIAMGFDRDEVEELASTGSVNAVASARDEDRYTDAGARRGSSRVVWWHEEYVRFDANDDGVAELLYVQRSDDYKVFAVEEVEDEDDHPYVDWCPFPMPHRRVGQSLADKVMDLERINTVLTRQTLDGIYLGNNPSTYVHEDSIGENTIEDLLTVRSGRVVRWKGNVAPLERGASFSPDVGFKALEFMDRRRESRTGITRLNMGLDEDTLNQTAKGQAQLIARGEQVEEYVARNFANAVAKLITKKARLLQRHGGPIEVPIDGEYRQVDPTQWPEDMIARARVGLGATRKDQRMALRREVIQMQQGALQAGLSIVDEDKFYNSAKGFIADANLGDVREYFNEPAKGPDGKPLPKPPQPNPEVMKAQAQIQAKQAELQLKQQTTGAQLQLKQAEAQAKLQMLREQGMQKAQIDAQKQQFDAQIAQMRAQAEADLAVQQMQIDAMMRQQEIEAEGRRRDFVAAKKYRDGGRLDK